MKTIFLRSNTKEDLVADIKQVCLNYNGETEFEQGYIFIHYIGDIESTPAVLNEDMTIIIPAVMVGKYHANLYVPNDFDTSILNTEITNPVTPVHQFA
jgi:hypothetical protein